MTLTAVIIVAGGRGERFGSDLPKQYATLLGSTVIRHTLRTFSEHDRIDFIQPVIRESDMELFSFAAESIETLPPVHGGDSRQASVFNGLLALKDINPDVVLVHDAARPFVPYALISNILDAVADCSGAIPGVQVVDTLKRSDHDGLISETVPRDRLWRAQTPQGFAYAELLHAHEGAAANTMTDDAAVMEAAGHSIRIVEGDARNIKVTTPSDLDEMEKIMSEGLEGPDFRVGSGFDVHKLGPGGGVILCGVSIPSDMALIGHSDADVAMHALTDAVLGAAALGDIGSHFPPSDEQWRGVASEVFLRHAVKEVSGLRWQVANVDLTVICEAPKVGPHRGAMRERLSEIIGVSTDRISVKATTTEHLGFTGRGEGIAAQASVLLSRSKAGS